MTSGSENQGITRIKVVGVGGGGCNAVAAMARAGIVGVDFICINTDAQALMRTEAPSRIRIGEKLTRGLGAGGDPERGRQAAEESREELADLLKDTDMVFLAAGMGGGTGTGAAPVLAELAKASNALTVAVVTRPFAWEGIQRRRRAEDGVGKLRSKVDTILVIPNDGLANVCDRKVTMANAFKLTDDVLRTCIQAIAELITIPGEINRDFADVRAVMENAGSALLGIGLATGDNRASEAARQAIHNPLLDVSIEGAKGVLINVTGGSDLTLTEVDEAAGIISKAVDPDANIFFGYTTDHKLENQLRVTLIATGFHTADTTAALTSPETISRLMQDAKAQEEKLDVPPFLRNRASNGSQGPLPWERKVSAGL